MSNTLPRWTPDRFSILEDTAFLNRLTEALHKAVSDVDPGPWIRLPDTMAKGSIADMLGGWCGVVGKIPLRTPEAIAKTSGSPTLLSDYDSFLRTIDHQRLLNDVTLQDMASAEWRLLDMGSLLDFLLISAFFDFDSETRVLEIGGGFGRLAEFLPKVTGQSFRYVNIDAAPVSLMYSYRYLQSAFPNKRVHLMEPGEPFSEDFDFLVVPFWCCDQLPKNYFDLAINVESMQEMSQTAVDHYVKFIDERVKDEGAIYLVNSREHLFKGTWDFPQTWRCVYRHRTVRSWTANHPAEFFRKEKVEKFGINLLRQAAFDQELALYRQTQELAELKRKIKYSESKS